MKIIQCQQGSSTWFEARLGRCTGSRMNDVMGRTAKGAETAKRATYRAELVCEILSGQATEHYVSKAMEHGTLTEPVARHAYELRTEQMVSPVGFVIHPSIERSGSSPDGILEDGKGVLEIKCGETKTHIGWITDGIAPAEHLDQMQWEMACTGAEYADFVSFDDRLPSRYQLFIVRVPRDDARISELQDGVRLFLREVDAQIAALNERMPELPAEPLPVPDLGGMGLEEADFDAPCFAAPKGEQEQ